MLLSMNKLSKFVPNYVRKCKLGPIFILALNFVCIGIKAALLLKWSYRWFRQQFFWAAFLPILFARMLK